MSDFVCKDSYNLDDYIALVAYLRSEKGCPWDRVQTHDSIRKNLLEEAYEVCEAIDEKDAEHLKEELGDLLLQVLFHSQIEKENGGFDIDDVADAACRKLVHRHPHVFGDAVADTAEKVLDTWDAVKRADRNQKNQSSAMAGISKALPSLVRGEKIQKRAAKLGFDWPIVAGAMDKMREEVSELQEGIDNDDRENIEEELGDVLFCVVNVARFYSIDAESAGQKACEKFIRRFRYLEEHAAAGGKKLEDMSLREMEEIYQMARHELEGKEPVEFSD